MEWFYYIYGGILFIVLFLTMMIEKGGIEGQINGGNGLIWLFIHIASIGASFVFAIIVFIFEDLATSGLALLCSLGYVVIEGIFSFKVINLTVDKVVKERKAKEREFEKLFKK